MPRPCSTLACAGIAATLMTFTPLAGAQDKDTVAVRHAQGETAAPFKPGKTVAFDLAVLDTMQTLGIKADAVPTLVHYPDFLKEYQDKSVPKVGTLFQPDYEAVNAAAPDLIIVAGRSAPKYGDLSRLAPTVDLTVDPKDLMGSIARNTRSLGAIYGKKDEAEAQLAELNRAAAALKEKAANAGSGLVVLTVGSKMSAYGPGSRFGAIHDIFGVPAAVKDLKTSNHGQAVSFEFIHKTNPDWLFVIDRDAAIGREGSSARQLLDNDLIRQTSAWQKQQVVYLDAMNWYLLGSAGLTSMRRNIDQLSQALDKRS